MNLIEALKQANGKPVRRKLWGNSSACLSLNNNWLAWGDSETKYGMHRDDLLADDWYVVEPKSKIEEAIERECLAFCWDYSGNSKKLIDRIVNIALDEAKRAFNPHDCTVVALYHTEVNQRIDALKVKE